MKNNLFFKFLAVLLCAAMLLGAVGCIGGVVLLTSGDLYNLTVEEMVQDQVDYHSEDFARWLAINYASRELGSCPEGLIEAQYGAHYYDNQYDPEHYGYRILDQEGEEVLSFHPELAELEDPAYRKSFTVSGKYLYLVEESSREETRDRENRHRLEAYGGETLVDEAGNTIPTEGAVVWQALFVDDQGDLILEAFDNGEECVITLHENQGRDTTTDMVEQDQLGFLFYNPTGRLTFRSFFNLWGVTNQSEFRQTEISEAYFMLEDGSAVRLTREGNGVGVLYLDERGMLIFVSEEILIVPETEETIPEETTETVPETVEATAAAETIAPTEETVAVEESVAAEAAVMETVPSAASEIPAEENQWTQPASTEPIPVETMPPETAPAETVPAEAIVVETIPQETAPEASPVTIQGKPLEEYQVNSAEYYNEDTEQWMDARFVYLNLEEMTVEITMTKDALRWRSGYEALELLRLYRNYLIPGAAACLLLFAVFLVYLCTAAGRKPRTDEVRAGGLNRLPLDVYLCGAGFGTACILAVMADGLELVMERDFFTGCALGVAGGYLCCLLMVGFCFAFVAQLKTPDGFWWRNTLVGHFFRLFFRFSEWMTDWGAERLLPFLGRWLKKLWLGIMKSMVWLYKATEKAMLWLGDICGKLGRLVWKGLHRFLTLLPVTWQWLMAGIVIIFCIMLIPGANDFMTVVFVMIPVAIILYIANSYGTLAEATRRMSKGDLETKVDDRMLVGCFKDSAADLNALADVAVEAAQKQLRSERMKSELVTNVSHDIKTPLTSIINYVDLLRKPHTEEEGEDYLEVLERQALGLKKLIDDLMDMSKANTGNMPVEITTVDAVEAVNQALGEYADKLELARVIPVVRHKPDSLLMQADGRLVWRVLSNLLVNVVKYAMPGTRLYVDVLEMKGRVAISLKNISREELNLDAGELMERFVRGDDSRNTEGSGLGLNIARSLMELQKGELELLVDGDLFKVTLIFPGAEE